MMSHEQWSGCRRGGIVNVVNNVFLRGGILQFELLGEEGCPSQGIERRSAG